MYAPEARFPTQRPNGRAAEGVPEKGALGSEHWALARKAKTRGNPSSNQHARFCSCAWHDCRKNDERPDKRKGNV